MEFNQNLSGYKISRNIDIYSVSRLNFEIKRNLEDNFFNIYLEGEVSNFCCHNNKHFYFVLKDEYSKIKVVMFYQSNKKLDFEIKDGIHLILTGYVSVYEKRGEYQFIATSAQPAGLGSMLLAFEQLKEKLAKKGYFDQSVKKNLPFLPTKIGAVTSTSGAVIKDIITILTKRYGNFHLIVRNVNVQGPTSSEEICIAIDDLCEYGVDVVIIARGGGSLEDLWAFNTEEVAEKVFKCPIPVISAVGHETDYTICDFVADIRAATPSVAATIVMPDKNELMKNIKNNIEKAIHNLNNKIYSYKKELNYLSKSRIFLTPKILLFSRWQDCDLIIKNLYEEIRNSLKYKRIGFNQIFKSLSSSNIVKNISIKKLILKDFINKIKNAVDIRINNFKNVINFLIHELKAKSPISVLERGFSFVLDEEEKKVIKSIKQVEIGKNINVILNDGILNSKILNIIKKSLKYSQ